MEVTIRPKNFTLAPDIEGHIRKHVERLPRHLDNLESAEILLSKEPTHLSPKRFHYVTQMTLHTRHNIIRSEVASPELLTAVDQAIDHLSRQIERYKGRLYRRHKGARSLGKSSAEMVNSAPALEGPTVVEMASPAEPMKEKPGRSRKSRPPVADGLVEDDELDHIVKVKRFSVKPMYPDEAIDQMELLGHSFFVFWNAAEEGLNVLYRRNDGGYGLLQPELS